MSYDVGDVVRCSGAFADSAGVAIDPTAVFCKVKTPSGVVTSYAYGTDAQLVKAGVGSYYVDVEAATTGTYYYRFYSTGTGKTAGEGSFTVRRSVF
jgi:uncharacterized protein YfaS (alpha-2-macroglobulin family)